MAGTTFLDKVIIDTYNTGFFDYALPFVITFAVIYGILQKTMLFGKQNKHLNSIFALIVSLMVLPFAAKVNYITFLAKLVFVIVKFVMLIIVLSLFGFKFEDEHKNYSIILALIMGGLIVLSEFFDITSLARLLTNANAVYVILIVAIFALVVWMISGKSPEEKHIERVKKVSKEPETAKEGETD